MEKESGILYGVVNGKNETGQVELILTQKTFSLVNQTLIAEHADADGTILQQYLTEVEAQQVFRGWVDAEDVNDIAVAQAEQLGGIQVIFTQNQAYQA